MMIFLFSCSILGAQLIWWTYGTFGSNRVQYCPCLLNGFKNWAMTFIRL